jgi:hypothetical protein
MAAPPDGVPNNRRRPRRAVLYNGLGRYDAALPPALSAAAWDEMFALAGSLSEAVEAAARRELGTALPGCSTSQRVGAPS